jgi:3-hydroxyisobutyrate dehydrogenase-like beta-hydroxyacid dehydrogenase
MGIGMALNLQKHLQESKQPSLHYSNRTLSKGESLKAAGGVEEPDYAALVKSCDIIFTMASRFLLR